LNIWIIRNIARRDQSQSRNKRSQGGPPKKAKISCYQTIKKLRNWRDIRLRRSLGRNLEINFNFLSNCEKNNRLSLILKINKNTNKKK